ncbi:protein ITPRID1 isoform X2 [Heptranchias perlo]|uniref:protein ITPRID1 isoform X2 n=1 Tax=Heptranchias perlo TaxID=212740 RepID=UPI003559C314
MASISVHPPALSNPDKAKRVNLASVKEAWTAVEGNSSGGAGDHPSPTLQTKNGDYKQQSIHEWLNTGCMLHVNEHRPPSPQRTGIMRKMSSTEDDLMLGVEAMLYPSGIQNMSVQEYMRTLHTYSEKHVMTRWNSIASTSTVNSGPKSVIELLDFWHDDPEEILLDLGFGKEEPDISAKIPARFINSSSAAIGINIGVFLDAQKLRMEMENPDLYSRFRQLEVLQQVSDVFSSLFTELATQKLTTEEKQPPETKEKSRKMGMLLRTVSQNNHLQNIKNSQNIKESRESKEKPSNPSGRDRRAAFQCPHQSIPEESILAPLTVEQSEAENKAPDLPPNVKEAQGCLLLEPSAKGRDRESQLITLQAKKPKLCTSNQPPDSFEMEEIQSFDEDSSPSVAANNNCLDMRRENSCQSDSSGFLEDPFIPSQIPRALESVSDDSIDSQATIQENRQWSSQRKDPGQATGSVTDKTSIPRSVDSDQAQCSAAHTVSRVLKEEKTFNVENLDSHSRAVCNQQTIAAPCAEKITGERNGLSGSSSCLYTTDLGATKQGSVPGTSSWLSNQVQVQNSAADSQNDNSVRSKATNVNNMSMTQEKSSLLPEHVTGTNKLVTIQITQDKLQQRNVTEVHSLESLLLLLQANKDTSNHESVLRGSGDKMRDASVQTDENTEACLTEISQDPQVKNFSLLVPEFQSGRLGLKSVSLDTGLDDVEENAQESTSITPAHCHHCHHCYCLHHHCSSTWFNGKDTKYPSKTAVSPSETQLIKTLQQLQQTARIISASPVLFNTDGASEFQEHLSPNFSWHKHAIREIETMKKSLQGFRNRLVEIEQDIIEQQASVYNVLTEDEREDVKRLQTLRRAVRQEVAEMEVQLEDWTRQVGEGMRMLQILMEEQSSFCSYLEVLKQTGDATSGNWPCPSISCMTPVSGLATTSQAPNSNAGTILPVPSVSGQSPVTSPAPSASNKTDTESNPEADQGAELTAKKQSPQSEMLDFRTILQNIKHSFQQLRSPSPEPIRH